MTAPRRTTINAELAARVDSDPDGAYLDFMGDAYSARRIDEEASRLAAALATVGVARGDRVASLLENSAEQVVTFFATLRLGAVAVPVNTAYKGEFLRHQLTESGARVVVVQGDFAGRVAEVAAAAPDLAAAVVVGEPDAAITAISVHDYAAFAAAPAAGLAPVEVAPSDLACLI
jgi:crotonobetaine/carnitine-CoA ligase